MRRAQLCLDNDLLNALHTRARKEGTTVFDLVRQAARERYLGDFGERGDAMGALVGIRNNRSDFSASVGYVRCLRRGRRVDRLGK